MIFFPYFFSSFSFISSQPPLSSHFLLHLPFEFLSFPPSPICVSPSTINPARLLSSDVSLPPTQLRSSPSADPARQSPQPILPTQLTDLPPLLTGPTPLLKCIPPLAADTHSRQPKPWVLPCSIWVSGLMVCGFDGGGFWPW